MAVGARLPAVALVLMLSSHASAEPSVLDMLDDLGAGGTDAAPPVAVSAWVEPETRNAPPQLVVSLIPNEEVRLVADPGIEVEATGSAMIEWLATAPVEARDEGVDYFAVPPMLHLPFAEENGADLEAVVRYAYCYSDQICLFGEETVAVPTRPSSRG